MPSKAVISLTTGLEDLEKVTVAYLVAVGAAESGRPTLMFLTKEAVRLAVDGIAVGAAALSPICSGVTRLPVVTTTSARSASMPRNLTRIRSSPTLRSKARYRCGSGLAMSPQRLSATDYGRRPGCERNASENIELVWARIGLLQAQV